MELFLLRELHDPIVFRIQFGFGAYRWERVLNIEAESVDLNDGTLCVFVCS